MDIIRKYGIFAYWIIGALSIMIASFDDKLNDFSLAYYSEWMLPIILMHTIESILLYLIIRPATYFSSWWRAGLSLILFFPWLLANLISVIYGPTWAAVHFFLLLLLNIVLFIMFISSIFRRIIL